MTGTVVTTAPHETFHTPQDNSVKYSCYPHLMDEEMQIRKLRTLFSETQLVSGRAFIWTEAACLEGSSDPISYFLDLALWGRRWLSREKASRGEHLSLRAVSPFPISIWSCSASSSHRQTAFWSERFKDTSRPASKMVQDFSLCDEYQIRWRFLPLWEEWIHVQTTVHSWLEILKIHPLKVVCFPRSWEN